MDKRGRHGPRVRERQRATSTRVEMVGRAIAQRHAPQVGPEKGLRQQVGNVADRRTPDAVSQKSHHHAEQLGFYFLSPALAEHNLYYQPAVEP